MEDNRDTGGVCTTGNGNREAGAPRERGVRDAVLETNVQEETDRPAIGGVTLLSRIEQLRPPIFFGTMTGARLISTAYMKRNSQITKDKNWGNPGASVSDDDDDSDYEAEGNNTPFESSKAEIYRQAGSSYKCSRCDESFRSQVHARKHARVCKTAAISTLFLNRAVICAKTHIENRTISVNCKASENPILQSMTVSEGVRNGTTFLAFWAVRPVSGIRLGTNFIDPFRTDIEEMVKQGNMDKSHKLSNGQMKEQLRMLYPNRMDIPTTYT